MLSIIIVSYNVKYFLEQCLYAVQKAIAGMDAEVFVIDNNSADETVGYLKEKFPGVAFIFNKENTGYAKANNQGWKMATGEYVLFLNPDTILPEDCLKKSIQVMESDKNIGGLGIKMIDGAGRFLPESKRGLPTPRASFYKLSGLINLFPHNKTIAQYYLGHLPANKNNEVDVLAGAFMLTRKEVLEKTGGFDERFFMYGEDIDLSICIKEAGYKNYYLAESSIIHFKGESTKKGMANTRLFYQAMGIFVSKHYIKQSGLFNVLMQLAIAVGGILSFVRQLFTRFLPAGNYRKMLQTIVAGSMAEMGGLVAVIGNQRIKRTILQVQSIPELYTILDAQTKDEIIFCAGSLSYKDIIQCIEKLAGKYDFKFFAATSSSIVASVSKKESGEVIVL